VSRCLNGIFASTCRAVFCLNKLHLISDFITFTGLVSEQGAHFASQVKLGVVVVGARRAGPAVDAGVFLRWVHPKLSPNIEGIAEASSQLCFSKSARHSQHIIPERQLAYRKPLRPGRKPDPGPPGTDLVVCSCAPHGVLSALLLYCSTYTSEEFGANKE
jgi:hypothetical protein